MYDDAHLYRYVIFSIVYQMEISWCSHQNSSGVTIGIYPIVKYQPFPLLSYVSVFEYQRWLYHHMLSGKLFFTSVQSYDVRK